MASNKELKSRVRRAVSGSEPKDTKAQRKAQRAAAVKEAQAIKATEKGNKKWPVVPAPLMDMVFNFLYEHGYNKAGDAIREETEKREHTGSFTSPCSWTQASKGYPSLVDAFNEWHALHPEATGDARIKIEGLEQPERDRDVKIEAKLDVEIDEGEESDDESSSSSESEDDDSSDDDESSPAKTTGLNGIKDKALASADSSSDSSSSSSDSESGGSDSKKSAAAINPLKRKAAPSSSSSNSSSSSSSSSDGDAEVTTTVQPAAASRKRKAPPSSSESSSSSSSSEPSSDSSSSSESDREPVKKKAKKATPPPNDVKAVVKKSESDESSSSGSSSSEDSSSESDSGDEEQEAPEKIITSTNAVTNGITSNGSESSATIARTSPDFQQVSLDALDENHKSTPTSEKRKKRNEPFRRIPVTQEVDPRFASNAYVPNDYSERAYQDLVVTKGKNFTKEKNKKKRGSYKGGAIDTTAVKAIKFDD